VRTDRGTTADVLAGDAGWAYEVGDALAWLRRLPAACADLFFASPPYTDARDYGIGAARGVEQWVRWLRPVVVEAARVCRLVMLNLGDRVRDCRYGCGPELLVADLRRLDRLDVVRPYAWVKSGPEWEDPGNGTPGSGGDHFHRNDWEPVYGFARRGMLPPRWSDPLAFGNPPKYGAGGAIRTRARDGSRKPKAYAVPPVSNPGNVVRVRSGGGRLGYRDASRNEAPMPLALAERFVRWFCPPGGRVIDGFAGSGTTLHAARLHGRRAVGIDLRQSQRALAVRRMRSVGQILEV
jgi:hypothetical protein